MKSMTGLFSILSLASLVSCGSPSGTSNGPIATQNETIRADGSNIKGFYAADLIPMNYNLHFKQVGTAGVMREDDAFTAYVKFKYGPKDTSVRQAIYTGRRCPNIFDDLNKDAYIDINEARIAIGQITIPLDADLSSQNAGSYNYPTTSGAGDFFYEVSTSFQEMFTDLKDEDRNPNDNVIKLAENDGITFPGRIVLIQGLSDKVFLPETVGTNEDGDKYETIPVACGVLWKVPKKPEELENQ